MKFSLLAPVWLANIFMSILVPLSGADAVLALPLLQSASIKYKTTVCRHKSTEPKLPINIEKRHFSEVKEYTSQVLSITWYLWLLQSQISGDLPVFQRDFSVTALKHFASPDPCSDYSLLGLSSTVVNLPFLSSWGAGATGETPQGLALQTYHDLRWGMLLHGHFKSH